MTDITLNGPHSPDEAGQASRRDFLFLVTASSAAIGVGALAWPLIDSLNPASDTLSLAQIEIDLTPIALGQGIIVAWRGRPVFIRRRTDTEIQLARAATSGDLRDPQSDADRVKQGHEQWLVVSGVCTHLGCVPGGSKSVEPRGEFGGWFCACHGSQYDTAGRIRKGPAPSNLPVPPFEFLSDNKIRIG